MNKLFAEDLQEKYGGYVKQPDYNWGLQPTHIPTPFIVPPEIKVGENWYVKFPGAIALVEVEIVEVTKQTVVIKQPHRSLSYLSNENRYKKSDIEFVEKVEEKL